MTRIAVIDTGPLSRAGMVSLLGTVGFEQVEEAPSLELLKDGAADRQQDPDILLVNLAHANASVPTLMEQVQAWVPQSSVVFLAETVDLKQLAECFAAGASGYISTSSSRETLTQSLRLVAAGGKVFPSELAPRISELTGKLVHGTSHAISAADPTLSERELDILRCLAKGCSNKIIAAELDIAEATVKVHIKRILRKTGVINRTQAALWAAAKGLTMHSFI